MKNLFCFMFLLPLVGACSESQEVVYKKPDSSGNPSISWDEIKPLVDEHCNKCHGKTVGQTFTKENYGSKATGRVANGTMPPGGGLPDDVKKKLGGYK